METTLNGLKYSNSEDDNVSTVSNPRAPQDGPKLSTTGSFVSTKNRITTVLLLDNFMQKRRHRMKVIRQEKQFKFTHLFQKTPVKVMKILGDFSTILFSRIRIKCTHVNLSSKQTRLNKDDTTWFMTY